MLTPEIIASIQASVLCWLATVSPDGQPSVSPKEAFTHDGEGRLLIANITSPQSQRNLSAQPSVCVSFIDVFVQKGYQVYGEAALVQAGEPAFAGCEEKLKALIGTQYPYRSVFVIQPTQVCPIIAPSYKLFPEKTVEALRHEAYQTYGVERIPT